MIEAEPPPSPPPVADPARPPHVAAIPPCPVLVTIISVVRWSAIAGMGVLGCSLVARGFPEAGLAVLLLAIAQLGTAVKMTDDQRRTLELTARALVIGAATAHGVKRVVDDVEDIRNNPAMPGTPTASGDGGHGVGGEGGHEAAG